MPNHKKIVDIAIYTKNGFRKNHRYRRQQKNGKSDTNVSCVILMKLICRKAIIFLLSIDLYDFFWLIY